MGSLYDNRIGNAGARDLGAALQINTTLMTLQWGWDMDVDAIWGGVGVLQLRWQRQRAPHDLGQCSHLHIGSLDRNNIGDAGARDLGAALQVNTTLTTLKWSRDEDVDAIWAGVGVLQLRWPR
jgi:hypothetical protein